MPARPRTLQSSAIAGAIQAIARESDPDGPRSFTITLPVRGRPMSKCARSPCPSISRRASAPTNRASRRADEATALEATLRALQVRLPRTGIGPYAEEWIPAPATNRKLNRAEQTAIDRIGRTHGCHRCGIKTSGLRSGHFIGDHQVPSSVGKPSRIYPHCWWCSNSQGGFLSKRRY